MRAVNLFLQLEDQSSFRLFSPLFASQNRFRALTIEKYLLRYPSNTACGETEDSRIFQICSNINSVPQILPLKGCPIPYLASLEVDQRQNFIQQADTLREMIGASGLISQSVEIAKEAQKRFPTVEFFWPVSGVLRFRSDDLPKLYRCLQEIRIELEHAGLTSSIGIVTLGSGLDQANREIDHQVRSFKDAKSGAIARPACPYFAPCGIQPQLPANHWRPHERDGRRRLTSHEAATRLTQHARSVETMYQGLNRRGLDIPYEMKDLVISDRDQYIAVIKADVDGLGRLLARLSFQQLALHRPDRDPIRASTAFTKALADCVKRAAHAAMDELSEQCAANNKHYPFVPLILAGDDLLILCQRHLALDFVWRLSRLYQDTARDHPVLKQAFEVSGLTGQESLTLSFGVLFCKQGFPFDAAVDMAEELVTSAKKRRHSLLPTEKEGCVDFHWLASSGRESVEDARRKGEMYVDSNATTYSLVTRPWLCSELFTHDDAAHRFNLLPSRKAHQLDTVLRLGPLSELAWKKWLSSLEPQQREAFPTSPWFPDLSTHWLEIAQMAETMRVPDEARTQ